VTSHVEMDPDGLTRSSTADVRFYRQMLRIRTFEDRLYQQRVPGIRVRAVTMADTPIPFSPPLEDSVLPSAQRVAAAAADLLAV
jgi:hypothetical protein